LLVRYNTIVLFIAIIKCEIFIEQVMTSVRQGFSTIAIHAGQDPQQWRHGSVVPPLVMSTTFQQDGPGQHRVSTKCTDFIHTQFLIDDSLAKSLSVC